MEVLSGHGPGGDSGNVTHCQHREFEDFGMRVFVSAKIGQCLHADCGCIIIFLDSVFQEISQAKLPDQLAIAESADFSSQMSDIFECLNERAYSKRFS